LLRLFATLIRTKGKDPERAANASFERMGRTENSVVKVARV